METLIAHRGWSGIAPENTLSAIRLALEEPKIKAIEIDINMTKDGIPVVFHDKDVDRTTNGTGAVKDLTLAELKTLDAGSWFGPEFAGERVPTLEEVLALVQGEKHLYIELKQLGDLYWGLELKTIELIKKFGLEDRCSLISFDHRSLQTCMKIAPEIRRTLVMVGSPLLLTEQVNEIGAAAVSMKSDYVDQLMVDSLVRNGTEIIVWTVDDPEEADRLAAFGGHVKFTSNHPDRLWAREEVAV
ncbi:glycerophosphodiester phosphodiesterase [Indiicoccus explosivorum]|uniref:glycerophosphodiester phosphodiesterase n=1 Tax=Indiicoccus explosivorum TaxID=1917864 RepID=UPI000B432C5F|nr:glycerophosphodiester phosphodiesterase family protein [Indiicoccus explosivorum]